MAEYVYIVNTVSEEGSFSIQGIFSDKDAADKLCNIFLKESMPASVLTHELHSSLPEVFVYSVEVDMHTGEVSAGTKIEPQVDPIIAHVGSTNMVVRGTSKEDATERAKKYHKRLSEI